MSLFFYPKYIYNIYQSLVNRTLSSTPNATVVGISATASKDVNSTDQHANMDDNDNTDDDEQVPCHVCGMIPAPVIPEAKQLPKPMQAAFQIPNACVETKAKVPDSIATLRLHFYIYIYI